MHNKFFVFDNEIIWTGSTNISDSGTGGYNANVSALIKSKEIASLYIEEFNQMYYQGKYQAAGALQSAYDDHTSGIPLDFSRGRGDRGLNRT